MTETEGRAPQGPAHEVRSAADSDYESRALALSDRLTALPEVQDQKIRALVIDLDQRKNLPFIGALIDLAEGAAAPANARGVWQVQYRREGWAPATETKSRTFLTEYSANAFADRLSEPYKDASPCSIIEVSKATRGPWVLTRRLR